MCLVVFVPFIASVNAVKISWFARSVFILPMIGCGVGNVFLEVEELFFFVQISLSFGSIQCFRGEVCATWRCFRFANFDMRLNDFRNKTRGSDSSALRKLHPVSGSERRAGNSRMTHDILPIFLDGQYINLPLLLNEFGDVNRRGTHGPVVWFHIRRSYEILLHDITRK